MSNEFELKIYNLDDRLSVAAVLVKNGYTVTQIKKKRTSTSKAVDYFLKVKQEECGIGV